MKNIFLIYCNTSLELKGYMMSKNSVYFKVGVSNVNKQSIIPHNKKDGAVSIRETIFCEFWSLATTVKKIFDKSCNFIDTDTSFA